MEKNWIIRTKHLQILGPVSKVKLEELIAKKALSSDDEICVGNGYWIKVKESNLVQKFLYNGEKQSFNPINEAKSYFANGAKERPVTYEGERTDSTTLVINLNDLKKQLDNNPNPTDQELNNKVTQIKEENKNQKLPKDQDLEYPDLIIPAASIENLKVPSHDRHENIAPVIEPLNKRLEERVNKHPAPPPAPTSKLPKVAKKEVKKVPETKRTESNKIATEINTVVNDKRNDHPKKRSDLYLVGIFLILLGVIGFIIYKYINLILNPIVQISNYLIPVAYSQQIESKSCSDDLKRDNKLLFEYVLKIKDKDKINECFKQIDYSISSNFANKKKISDVIKKHHNVIKQNIELVNFLVQDDIDIYRIKLQLNRYHGDSVLLGFIAQLMIANYSKNHGMLREIFYSLMSYSNEQYIFDIDESIYPKELFEKLKEKAIKVVLESLKIYNVEIMSNILESHLRSIPLFNSNKISLKDFKWNLTEIRKESTSFEYGFRFASFWYSLLKERSGHKEMESYVKQAMSQIKTFEDVKKIRVILLDFIPFDEDQRELIINYLINSKSYFDVSLLIKLLKKYDFLKKIAGLKSPIFKKPIFQIERDVALEYFDNGLSSYSVLKTLYDIGDYNAYFLEVYLNAK